MQTRAHVRIDAHASISSGHGMSPSSTLPSYTSLSSELPLFKLFDIRDYSLTFL